MCAEDDKMLNAETAFSLGKLLDEIDEEYQKKGKTLTIIYDALDRVVQRADWSRFISALIDMWYMKESGMKSIRSKIFLRKDIFEREVKVADKVKLKNYSVTIGWEYDQLFAMVWKRIIGKAETVKNGMRNAAIKKLRLYQGLDIFQ